jgi:sucrose phosphorylase
MISLSTANEQQSPMKLSSSHLRVSLSTLLKSVYPHGPADELTDKVLNSFWGNEKKSRRRGRIASNSLWSEKDSYVICYGNSLVDGEHKPLDLLHDFLNKRLQGIINGVHILPYFPYTSDDGFAVTDYTAVDSRLGSWADIQRISENFRLMSDLVLNHCSSQGHWFNSYRLPGIGFFVKPYQLMICPMLYVRGLILCYAKLKPPWENVTSGAHSAMIKLTSISRTQKCCASS